MLLLCVLTSLNGASAETYTVDAAGSTALSTIGQAVSIAVDGDTIDVMAGTYTETLNLEGKTLTITGSDPESTILDASGHPQSLLLSGGGLTMSGLTMRNSGGQGIVASAAQLYLENLVFEEMGDDTLDGSGILMRGGYATIRDCSFIGGEGRYGGAIYLTNAADALLENSTISGHLANYGGAINVERSNLQLIQVEISSNVSENYGGGIHFNEGSLQAVELTMRSNSALYGGGLSVFYSSITTISASYFMSNDATNDGAGIYAYDMPAPLELEDVVFDDNEAIYGSGGGLSLNNVELSMVDSELTGNQARYGGAIYGYDTCDLSIEGSTLSDNQAPYNGGAIYHDYYGSLTVSGSLFEDNVTDYSGGAAIWSRYPTDVRIDQTTFIDNHAAQEGGAVHVREASGSLEISDSIFLENEVDSTGFGGGLFLYGMGETLLLRNHFQSNFGGFGGGVYVQEIRPGEASQRWLNNGFQDNFADQGGAACLLGVVNTALVNNTLVGNQAATSGAALCMYDAGITLLNNVVAYHAGSEAIVLSDSTSADTAEFAYNNLFSNVDGDVGGELDEDALSTERGNLFKAPAFAFFSNDGDPLNDSLVLAVTSPLIDRGAPYITDPDETRSDIGMYGGPEAPTWDSDEDGYDARSDCDDEDPTTHPGADETWYDGINSDCSEGSDYDADADGEDAQEWGGLDCDDSDPEIIECDEPEADTGESDTGSIDSGVPSDPGMRGKLSAEGCTCSLSAPSTGMSWLWLAMGWIGLRRRRQHSAA